MATVGSVIAALQGLDPALPVGALRVERHSEVTAFDLGDVVEVHVEHAARLGSPAGGVGGGRVADGGHAGGAVRGGAVEVDGDAGRLRVCDAGAGAARAAG